MHMLNEHEYYCTAWMQPVLRNQLNIEICARRHWNVSKFSATCDYTVSTHVVLELELLLLD